MNKLKYSFIGNLLFISALILTFSFYSAYLPSPIYQEGSSVKFINNSMHTYNLNQTIF